MNLTLTRRMDDEKAVCSPDPDENSDDDAEDENEEMMNDENEEMLNEEEMAPSEDTQDQEEEEGMIVYSSFRFNDV